MRVLVCGGRWYGWPHRNVPVEELGIERDRVIRQRNFLTLRLDYYHKHLRFSCMIEGEATGADTLARMWAEANHVPVEKYPVTPAMWQAYGRGAGHVRNARMLNDGRPAMVIAFPGDSGTANMLSQAVAARLAIISYGSEGL